MHPGRNSSVGIAALTAGILAGPTPALAVLNGALDGNNHPSVGFVFAQQTDPNVCSAEVVSTCSATLPSSTVALTSGGCAEVFADAPNHGYNLTAIWISFNPDDPFDCATASRVDSIHFHPSFDETQVPSPFDIGVFVLAAPAANAPASLPAAGSQGGYVRGDPFEVVNRGGVTGGNIFDYRRRFSPADFTTGDADFIGLRLTLTGGHICTSYVEGGGAFLPASQNLSALIIHSDGGCKRADYLRLDTATARDFLDDYVTVP